MKAVEQNLDVCIPYFNHGDYLPQLLLSLERQTSQDFNVTVVDDGSTDESSIQVFDDMRQRYESSGWTFIRQKNSFVDAARNVAAAAGTAKYITFLDADDVASINLVERFQQAVRLSKCDCLMSCYYEFQGEGFPLDLYTGEVISPAVGYKRPIGVDLLLSLSDPDVLGSPVMIVRRKCYEAVGGFTETPHAGHEDYEFYIKLAFAGFDIDVLPEALQFKRAHNSNLSSHMDRYLARMRIVNAYERRLRQCNLEGLAGAVLGLSQEVQSLRYQVALRETDSKSEQPAETETEKLPTILRPRDVFSLSMRQKVQVAKRAVNKPRHALGFLAWHTKAALLRLPTMLSQLLWRPRQ
jgi:glycosyltransferase involved in cell wall biosynthesis